MSSDCSKGKRIGQPGETPPSAASTAAEDEKPLYRHLMDEVDYRKIGGIIITARRGRAGARTGNASSPAMCVCPLRSVQPNGYRRTASVNAGSGLGEPRGGDVASRWVR